MYILFVEFSIFDLSTPGWLSIYWSIYLCFFLSINVYTHHLDVFKVMGVPQFNQNMDDHDLAFKQPWWLGVLSCSSILRNSWMKVSTLGQPSMGTIVFLVINGGFLKLGYPQFSSVLDWDFPWNKPTSELGVPPFTETLQWRYITRNKRTAGLRPAPRWDKCQDPSKITWLLCFS